MIKTIETISTQTNMIYTANTKERYYLSVCWKKSSPAATVIMKRPSKTNGIFYDNTVNHTLELLYNEGYGKVYIVNLFCSESMDDTNNSENWKYLNDSIRKSKHIMLFFGKLSGVKVQHKRNALHKLADLLKTFEKDGKHLNYHILTKDNKTMCMPTLPGGEIKERSFDEILKLLGEK